MVATEYLLLEEYQHPEYFNKQQITEYVVQANGDIELVEPVDFTLPPEEYLIDSVIVPYGVDRFRRHVILNDGKVQRKNNGIF